MRPPQRPGVVALLGLRHRFVMREYSAGVGQTRSEFLPLTGRGVALDQGTRRPVASPSTSQPRLIHMQLPPEGHDVPRTQGPYGARLLVVGLVQDTTNHPAKRQL